jgi:putative hydrolase of the HAD superfamily
MNTKHLFFDLDRTLWDFEKNSEIALNHLFDELELNQNILNFQTFHQLYKENNSLLWKQYGAGTLKKEVLRDERFRLTLEQLNVLDPNIVKRMSDGYVDLSPKQTALFPNAIETLQELQLEGFNMHIITNGFKEVQHIKLEKSGLTDFFDIIVCSEDVGKNKPSPDIFHHSLKHANAKPSDSVMIGDDFEVDILGALNIGMKGIHFDPKNQHTSADDTLRIRQLNELPGMMPWVFKINL